MWSLLGLRKDALSLVASKVFTKAVTSKGRMKDRIVSNSVAMALLVAGEKVVTPPSALSPPAEKYLQAAKYTQAWGVVCRIRERL